jgi:hypothetical protein
VTKRIELIIPLRGLATGRTQVQVTTEGFVGSACQDATKALQAALGGQQQEELTPEYYQTEKAEEHLRRT